MSTHDVWEEVDVLIPKRAHENRRRAIQDACTDIGALVGVLPGTTPADGVLSMALALASPDACKAWVARVIRALPTVADLEATHDD